MAQMGFRRFLGILSSEMTGRHTVITESLTLNVLNSLQNGACQTVRVIVLWNSVAVASVHTILAEHMYRISGFSVIWSAFDHMCSLRRSDAVTIALTPFYLAAVTFETSECSAYFQVMMLFACHLRPADCSHMIEIIHIERNKVVVSSHLKSSL